MNLIMNIENNFRQLNIRQIKQNKTKPISLEKFKNINIITKHKHF